MFHSHQLTHTHTHTHSYTHSHTSRSTPAASEPSKPVPELQSEWKTFYRDQEIRAEIDKDVKRTYVCVNVCVCVSMYLYVRVCLVSSATQSLNLSRSRTLAGTPTTLSSCPQ
jgi:hypothetical protein